MTKQTPEILALGEPLLELNATTKGALESARTFSVGYGGDTSNFAIAAARAGGAVSYLTRIGDDAFGTILSDLWREEGVDTRYVTRERGGRTGIYFISRRPDGHAFTYYRTDSPASRLQPHDVPEQAVAGSRLLHVTGITQAISPTACDTAFHAMQVARAHGTLVTYDPNHRAALWPAERAKAIIMRSIELADIALPNQEEGRLLTGVEDPEAMVDAFLERGPRVVVLKMGDRGVLIGEKGRQTHVKAHAVEAVDASGAGDTFDGVFCSRLLEGAEPVEAARLAVIAAALTTTGLGAVGPIPRRTEVDALMGVAAP